jgi:hypothetical protein
MLMTQAVIDKMNAMITAPIQEEMPGLEPDADVAKGNNQYRRSNLFLKSSQAERPDGQQDDTINDDDVAQGTSQRAVVLVRRSASINGGIQQLQRYLLRTKLQEA